MSTEYEKKYWIISTLFEEIEDKAHLDLVKSVLAKALSEIVELEREMNDNS